MSNAASPQVSAWMPSALLFMICSVESSQKIIHFNFFGTFQLHIQSIIHMYQVSDLFHFLGFNVTISKTYFCFPAEFRLSATQPLEHSLTELEPVIPYHSLNVAIYVYIWLWTEQYIQYVHEIKIFFSSPKPIYGAQGELNMEIYVATFYILLDQGKVYYAVNFRRSKTVG